MRMVYRVYVEKRDGFDVEAKALADDARALLQVEGLTNLRLLNRYDVSGISEELFEEATRTIFSEPQLDTVFADLPEVAGAHVFAVEYQPGQFDQRADSAAQCIQILSQGERPAVRNARVYLLESGEKGTAQFRLTIKGEAGHASVPLRSGNALFIDTGIFLPGGRLTLLSLDEI